MTYFGNPDTLPEDDSHWFRAVADVSLLAVSVREDGDLEWHKRLRPDVRIWMEAYPVLRRTPKGVWLDTDNGDRFVLRHARKRWACPTRAEALESLKARSHRRRVILRAQLEKVDAALHHLETNQGDQ